jgi:transcriptional regulator with XRE-family HTH domain
MESDFRDNLREELDYQGLTVKELSVKTGIAKRTLDCYLDARRSMPPADAACKIAEALHVSVEYLVRGEENLPKNQAALYNRTLRALIETIQGLSEKDQKKLLSIAEIFKTS